MTIKDDLIQQYVEFVDIYISSSNDEATNILERSKEFSNQLIKSDSLPDDLVQLHIDAIETLNISEPTQIKRSLNVLHKVMVGFGFTYQDYKTMADKIEEHDKEMDVASKLQETMLKTEIPNISHVEIGALSVPAYKVSGDYFNIIDHKDGMISFAIADVIGKGIPAAIAMGMIKFGMDAYGYSQLPSDSLRKLNRVVEKNVNTNMFITMFYGLYDISSYTLYFSSAGHEPALIYRYETDTFEEIDAKGIVLGVKKFAHYEQRETVFGKNDMFIGYTDGVSELRKADGEFIDLDEIKSLIREVKDHHPQDIVQYVYEKLIRLQDSDKKDDFTIFILKNAQE